MSHSIEAPMAYSGGNSLSTEPCVLMPSSILSTVGRIPAMDGRYAAAAGGGQ